MNNLSVLLFTVTLLAGLLPPTNTVDAATVTPAQNISGPPTPNNNKNNTITPLNTLEDKVVYFGVEKTGKIKDEENGSRMPAILEKLRRALNSVSESCYGSAKQTDKIQVQV